MALNPATVNGAPKGCTRQEAQTWWAEKTRQAAGLSEAEVSTGIVRRLLQAWERLRAHCEDNGVIYAWYESPGATTRKEDSGCSRR